tara:strand:+ start:121 stop:336 length:216 start_codon:yes stop_codon:yes gene_type:complete
MVEVRDNRRKADRRKSTGLNLYVRNLFSTDRRKLERENQNVINKDFITWLFCVVSSFSILAFILITSYIKG